MRTEKKEQKCNARKRMLTLAEASESVLTNLPLLICGLALTLALFHDWTI
jgi:hypothetical protein